MRIFLPTIAIAAAEIEFFYRDKSRDGQLTPSNVKSICENERGSLASPNDPGLAEFIDSLDIKRRRYFLLVDEFDDPRIFEMTSDKNFELASRNEKNRTSAICKKEKEACVKKLLKSYERYNVLSVKDTFAKAAASCSSFGPSWNLMIINTKRELTFLNEIAADECWEDEPIWLGWKEFDTVAPASRGRLETVFGRETEWEPKWERGQPDDAATQEECVVFRDGKFHDTSCEEKAWIICEGHNFIEFCEPEEVDPWFTQKYSVHAPEDIADGKNWTDARAFCQEKGDDWDLAVPNSEIEFNYLVRGTQCSTHRFWLGAKYTAISDELDVDDGIYEAVDGSTEKNIFRRWDTHTNWISPPPHNKPDEVECLRMRGDLMNTRTCDTAGKHVPHGWICEKN